MSDSQAPIWLRVWDRFQFYVIVLAVVLIFLGIWYALFAGSRAGQQPTTTGQVELHIQEPSDLDGTGTADCYLQTGGTAEWAVVGRIEGMPAEGVVTISVESTTDERLGPTLFITFEPGSNEPPLHYGESGEMRLDIGRTGTWGTIRFDQLGPALGEARGPFDRESISGSVSWDCRDAAR